MDHKRLVVATEPSSNARFNNEIIKELTGGKNLNARLLYSNNTEVKLTSTLIVECNERPEFASEINNAEIERVILDSSIFRLHSCFRKSKPFWKLWRF